MNRARILHTMLRVGDLQQSIDFYTQALAMKVLRTFDNPTEEYSLTFLGYAEESEDCVLELTYNYGVAAYEKGNAFGHIAIGVEDCYKACNELKNRGEKIVREAGPIEGLGDVAAFIEDPDGYLVELIERPGAWLRRCEANA